MLIERGRRQIDRRATQLLLSAKRAGLLDFDETADAYETLYGLIVRDLHVRMLLGEDIEAVRKEFGPRAAKAVSAFLRLFGTRKALAE
jgi:hypothetical protein